MAAVASTTETSYTVKATDVDVSAWGQQQTSATLKPTLTSRLSNWYSRVDKVEFWASVAAIGYYLAHFVLGVL